MRRISWLVAIADEDWVYSTSRNVRSHTFVSGTTKNVRIDHAKDVRNSRRAFAGPLACTADISMFCSESTFTACFFCRGCLLIWTAVFQTPICPAASWVCCSLAERFSGSAPTRSTRFGENGRCVKPLCFWKVKLSRSKLDENAGARNRSLKWYKSPAHPLDGVGKTATIY